MFGPMGPTVVSMGRSVCFLGLKAQAPHRGPTLEFPPWLDMARKIQIYHTDGSIGWNTPKRLKELKQRGQVRLIDGRYHAIADDGQQPRAGRVLMPPTVPANSDYVAPVIRDAFPGSPVLWTLGYDRGTHGREVAA